MRVLLLGTLAVMLTGVGPRPAQAQFRLRQHDPNPYYSFFWDNYWQNYAYPYGSPGSYWGYYAYPRGYYPYWGYYPYSWYGYGYPAVYSGYVPPEVAVPESNPAPAAKAPKKADAKKPVLPEKEPRVPEPKVRPAEPKPPLTPEERKKQDEQDAARQLRLAKILLEAADEEQATGKEKDANRLRQLARGHFAEIAQNYASTPAGKDAQQPLEKEKTP